MTRASFSGRALIVTLQRYADVQFDLGPQITWDGDLVASTLLDPRCCGYQPENVVRLQDGEVTQATILDQITSWSSLSPDIPLLMYFSGHGFSSPMSNKTGLCLHDFNGMGQGELTAQELRAAWSNTAASRKLIILDSCHAGGVPATKNANKYGPPSYALKGLSPDAVGTSGGSVVMASSRSDQLSNCLHHDQSSLFTKHFVAGLRGAAGHDEQGYVRLFDLFEHVRAAVSSEISNQTPVLSTHELDENFRLAYCAQPAMRKIKNSISPENNSDSVELEAVFSELYPQGPMQDEIWERAGGDASTIVLTGTGRSQWRIALRKVRLGGGGPSINYQSLVEAALKDYPGHLGLHQAISGVAKTNNL